MSAAPMVAVRGEFVREIEPELASFVVTARARDADRATVLSLVTRRHKGVRGMLDQYRQAIERRETSNVTVYPERKGAGERVRAYVATVTTKVVVNDFAVLGDLMLGLSDVDQVVVTGPWWSLRPNSPVYGEARRAAVGAAIDRAREYAEALGAEVVRLIRLADEGIGGDPQPQVRFAASAYGSLPRGGGAEAPQLDLDPQRQTVRAAVEARFEISEPTVLG